jgi:hypothetical protein
MSITYHRHPDALHTDLIDELIVVDGSTGHSWRLNASARKAWLCLPTTAEQLAEVFRQAYGLAAEDALRDARAALEEFVGRGIAVGEAAKTEPGVR